MINENEIQLTVPKCILPSFGSTLLMLESSNLNSRRIASLTAMCAMMKTRNQNYKMKCCYQALRLPFFKALYNCYGRGF